MKVSAFQKKIAIITLSVLMAISLMLSILPQWRSAAAEEESSAYFLTEDRNTQGFWYSGDDGLIEHKENRNYGKDGVVLFFHWLRQNGQQSKDVEFLNDFTNDTTNYATDHEAVADKANYVEYPSYVSSIEGNITSIEDDPFGYWMNTPQSLDESLANSQNAIQPLPIEGVTHNGEQFKWSHGGFQAKAGNPVEFTVISDAEEYRTVSFYVGCPWRHKYFGTDDQWVRVYDLEGNIIAQHLVENVNQGVYVRFAVKGSFKISLTGTSLSAYVNGLFFDPFTENQEIGSQNLIAALEGSKTINLTWENKSAETYTSIYRREKGAELWDFLGETEPGIASYTDNTAKVSTTYEYALSSATIRTAQPQYEYRALKADFETPEIRVKSYNLPNFGDIAEIKTADYRPTKIEFETSGYAAQKGQDFNVKVKLYKEKDDSSDFEVYPGVKVFFKLDGDNVYSILGINTYENMNPVFGNYDDENAQYVVTDENGEAEVTGSIPYAGEYELIAYIEPQPDPENDFYGFDACESRVSATASEPVSTSPQVPVLWSVTDGVTPGDAVSLMGYNLADDGDLKIAYAKNQGKAPGAFEEGRHFYYLTEEDISFIDSANGSGIMFIFPATAQPGAYDFYVHNAEGWSNGITMNAVRPIYTSAEAAYEGQEVQIVGRNFLQYEYGVGDLQTSYANLKVKLTQVADEGGAPASGLEYILTERNGGILTGNKVTADEAMQFDGDQLKAEAIPYTHTSRITIKVPAVHEFGTYEISVASDGEDFRSLVDYCPLKIYPKEMQNWNTEVFGPYNSAINGNDPLGLGVYWVQGLNYTNVTTMNPNDALNTFETAEDFTKDLNNKIRLASENGGGVIYFPAGTYYLFSDVILKKNVILVGAGSDPASGTILKYCNNKATNKVWFKAGENDINIGIANVYWDATDARLQDAETQKWYAPKFVVQWSGEGTYDDDKTLTTVKNRFLSNIKSDVVGGPTLVENQCQRNISVTGKNCVMQNCEFIGILISTELRAYGIMWNVKMVYEEAVETSPHWMGRYCFMENCYFDMQGMGHGPSVKSDQYIAYSYVTNAGNREFPTNDGEVLLIEAPTGSFSTGRVLTASDRSITLDFTGGQYVNKDMTLRFNLCAVYISKGKGAGQYRYIRTTGQGEYGNTYSFMDWEKDWDVTPDSTSVFACIAPLANMTVYHLKAYDCVSSICVYQNNMDTLVDGCTLVNTAGITGGGLASGGMTGGRVNPANNVRIVNNDISGLGSHTMNGGMAASVGQSGGIQFYSGGSGEYMGLLSMGLTIRDNYLHDLFPNPGVENHPDLGSGITLYFRGGQDNNVNGMRYVIVEDNIIEGSEWGLYIEREMVGVSVHRNKVSGTVALPDNATIERPTGLYASAQHNLYIGDEKLDISGEYVYGMSLPELSGSDGKIFYGWSTSKDYKAGDPIYTLGFITEVDLYAVFGYEVSLNYNYVTSDSADKGELASFVVLGGQSAADEISNYIPFRTGGYYFDGWYIDRACTVAYNTEAPVEGNLTLYAKWVSENETPDVEDPEDKDEKGGCISTIYGGSLVVSAVTIAAVALVLILTKKRQH